MNQHRHYAIVGPFWFRPPNIMPQKLQKHEGGQKYKNRIGMWTRTFVRFRVKVWVRIKG
jgi:hypothetical protein